MVIQNSNLTGLAACGAQLVYLYMSRRAACQPRKRDKFYKEPGLVLTQQKTGRSTPAAHNQPAAAPFWVLELDIIGNMTSISSETILSKINIVLKIVFLLCMNSK
jgi:hypothetical protein